ncbi:MULTISPECIES: hypothetical protein [unclassified Massilia]|uniref:hypothetical protein n=1 Tax=unclassified Massilia TaxID=2609279 RepID=UPI00177B9833|nr:MULTISPECIES: hypothetical protein [unclassified Massilia]MBD8531690.1 hypothetical protein [Massilia sp. CFBP 13647]MBD8675135.1 hypothetical protein [Massilia sp. CFBP 13721]
MAGKRAPHFAHAPGADCATGAETAVHLAAKQIIETQKFFFFPKLVVSAEEDDPIVGVCTASRTLFPDGRRRLAQVEVETAVASIRPDLIVHTEHFGTVAIEIAVTHFVDEAKQSAFVDLGLSVVEVNLSTMREVTFALLEKLLLDSCEHSQWLHHSSSESAQNELRHELHVAVQDSRARYAAKVAARHRARKERLEQEASEARRRARERERLAIRAKIEREAAEAARAMASLEKTALFKAADEVGKRSILESWFKDGSLPGNVLGEGQQPHSFGMQDTHIWQTAMFIGLVHKRPARGLFVLTADSAFRWMMQRFDSPAWQRDSNASALCEYLRILADRGALIAKPQGYFHLGVADLASFDQLQELFKSRVRDTSHLAQRVAWVDQDEWPIPNQRYVIALVMSGAQSLKGAWRELARIEDGARKVTPLQACQWGASLGLDEAITLEFLVRAGYVRFID